MNRVESPIRPEIDSRPPLPKDGEISHNTPKRKGLVKRFAAPLALAAATIGVGGGAPVTAHGEENSNPAYTQAGSLPDYGLRNIQQEASPSPAPIAVSGDGNTDSTGNAGAGATTNETGQQIYDRTFGPESWATGDPAVDPSPSPDPVETPVPSETAPVDEVQQSLDDWLAVDSTTGEYINNPYPKRFGNVFEILNFEQAPAGRELVYKYHTWSDFQGELLASEEVVDADGNNELIAYIGMEDWGPSGDATSVLQKKNTRYIIPFSLGNINYNFPAWFHWKGKENTMALVGLNIFDRFTTTQIKDYAQQFQGQVVGVPVFPFKMNAKVFGLKDPRYQEYFNEGNARLPVLRDLIDLSLQVNYPLGPVQLKDARIPDSIQSIMNKRVLAGFAADSLPLGLGLANK